MEIGDHGHTSNVTSVAVTPDGTKIVSGSWDITIKVWNLNSGALIQTLTGHSDYLNSVAITPDGTKIMSGSSDKTINVWNLASGALIQTLSNPSDTVLSVAITPDGTKIVSGSYYSPSYWYIGAGGGLQIWNLISGALILTLGNENYYSVAITPDGSKIVSGSDAKTIKIWNLTSGALVRTLTGHTGTVQSHQMEPRLFLGLRTTLSKSGT
jgi:WD40 repeat protein